MKLILNGLGVVEITDAKRVPGDDIIIESADNFQSISKVVGYEIKEAYLVEVDFKWTFIAWLNVPDDYYIDDSAVFYIENQDDIYRLNARL